LFEVLAGKVDEALGRTETESLTSGGSASSGVLEVLGRIKTRLLAEAVGGGVASGVFEVLGRIITRLLAEAVGGGVASGVFEVLGRIITRLLV
jgi:hypothetical protein